MWFSQSVNTPPEAEQKTFDRLFAEVEVISLLLQQLVKHPNENGFVDLNSNRDLWNKLREASNKELLDSVLYNLDLSGVIMYNEVGEDGFEPFYECSVDESTTLYLNKVLRLLKSRMLDLQKQNSDFLTFNPEMLAEQVRLTQTNIDEVKKAAAENNLLAPILQPISEIERHFAGVSAISKNYSEIHKHIVKPIKDEFKKSARSTVGWAIAGLAISTIVSILLQNWSAAKAFFQQIIVWVT
jgi:hypothetical protein